MPKAHTIKWKWGILAAVVVTLLALIPQFFMWGTRGLQWNGSYAEQHGDEWVYSAYVQALIDGRPRRNDPYTGRDERPGHPQPESLFSIQFVPAYLIAAPARLLGISSSTAFILLGIVAPFLSCLAIFWLLANVTEDEKLASAGAVVVLSFGALAAGQGLVHLFISGSNYSFLPFLRRYEPLAPFPLFFVFCALTWKSLTDRNNPFAWPLMAGLCLALLVFSYFFLWTPALAWLICLAFLWFIISKRDDSRQAVRSFAIILVCAVAALIPYAVLVSRRSQMMDAGQKLILSHTPDLFRVPELLGLAVFGLLAFGVKRERVAARVPATIFAASFALTPLFVFNQQIITGRSLQPFHYEWFIANYLALIGLVITSILLWRGREVAKPVRYRVAGRIVFIAVWWAVIEVLAPVKVIIRDSQFTDRAAAVGRRLKELSRTEPGTTSELDPRPLVLATENKVAVVLPTFTSHAVFWAPHFDFLHLAAGESRARFYQYLYYTGVDGRKFKEELSKQSSTFAAATFGHERVIPDLAVQVTAISADEIAQNVAEYENYRTSFTRELAAQHVISYLVVPAAKEPDFSNLDRWYARDGGELVGDYKLYRVRLRP